MTPYSQAGRPMSITTPLGPDALLLEELHGSEAVSELFRFRLELLADAGRPVPFEKVLGQGATVALALPGGQRYLSGVVRRFAEGPQLPGARGRPTFTRYRMELVPRLWLWTKKVRSRIFQQMSVPDILQEVLAGLDVDLRLQGEYRPRDYCVQYRESDFAFASRLLEDEGICYFFTHTANGHTLVLADGPQGFPFVPGPSQLHFEEVAGEARPDDRVLAWEKAQELRAGKYTAWDYAFQMPPKNLGASATAPGSVQAGAVTHPLQLGGGDQLELFDYPGGYARRVDGVGPSGNDQAGRLGELFSDNQRVADIRMEQETAGALMVTGESTCRQLAAGHKFALDRHPSGNGGYLLTGVEHAASLAGAYTGEGRAGLEYRNRFACVPQGLAYRPERATPRPRVAGVQTAVVVGPDGEDVFTDKHGRIKVQFFWDRQAKDQGTNRNGSAVIPLQYWSAGNGAASPTSSCWVRVAQSWAGRGWGGMVIPRVGQEVVIAFEEGDPDRPLCLGCVYNQLNQPPLPLPERSMDTALKSSSVGGDSPNFSGLAIHDELGEEHVQLHSERDLTVMAEQHHVVNVGADQHVNVGNTAMTTVGALPGGSGGGGGGGVTYKGAFDWQMGDISASVGKSLQLIYGEQTTAVAGLAAPWCFGSFIQVVMNPLGWLGQMIPVPVLQALSAPLLGRTNFTIGSFTTMTYGATFNAQRGPEVKLQGKPSPLSQGLALLVAALSTVDIWVAGATDPKHKVTLIAGLGGGAAGLLSLLALSEVLTAVEGMAKVIDAAAKAGEMSKSVAELETAVAAAQQAQYLAKNKIFNLKEGLTALQNKVNVVNGHHVVNARTISLQSNNSTTVSSGDRDRKCVISLDGLNPLMGLSLVYAAATQPVVRLNQEGVTISAGAPLAGPQITLSPHPAEGLTLSYGPPGAGCSIALNATGITLKVGATTVLTLTPESIILGASLVNVNAEGKLSILAGDMSELVDGIVERMAASNAIK
jgi:type VI secretion system secreted protein VgrG